MKAVAFFTIAMASSLPAPSAAIAAAARMSVPATAETNCMVLLVFTANLRIGWSAAVSRTAENSHKRGNHPLRLPLRRTGNGGVCPPKFNSVRNRYPPQGDDPSSCDSLAERDKLAFDPF